MDSKLRDYVSKKTRVLFGRLPLDIEDETLTIRDSYRAQERKYIKYQINVCEEFLKLKPKDIKVKKWKSEYISKLQMIEDSFPFPSPDLTKLTSSINNAFFKVESFINGNLKGYDYFGFFDAFMILFEEAKKPKNWSIENNKLIGHYWMLIHQIEHDVYNSGYAVYVVELPQFNDDIDELMAISSNFLDEFNEFITQDEIDEYNRRVSILDIWKSQKLDILESKVSLPPTFKQESVPEIFKILQSCFTKKEEFPLIDLLNGKEITKPIVFRGQGGTLCDLFKQLYLGRFLFIGVQTDLEKWIISNFLYTDIDGHPKELKLSYVTQFISEGRRPAQGNRLIEIESVGGKSIIVQVKKKTRKKY